MPEFTRHATPDPALLRACNDAPRGDAALRATTLGIDDESRAQRPYS